MTEITYTLTRGKRPTALHRLISELREASARRTARGLGPVVHMRRDPAVRRRLAILEQRGIAKVEREWPGLDWMHVRIENPPAERKEK